MPSPAAGCAEQDVPLPGVVDQAQQHGLQQLHHQQRPLHLQERDLRGHLSAEVPSSPGTREPAAPQPLQSTGGERASPTLGKTTEPSGTADTVTSEASSVDRYSKKASSVVLGRTERR